MKILRMRSFWILTILALLVLMSLWLRGRGATPLPAAPDRRPDQSATLADQEKPDVRRPPEPRAESAPDPPPEHPVPSTDEAAPRDPEDGSTLIVTLVTPDGQPVPRAQVQLKGMGRLRTLPGLAGSLYPRTTNHEGVARFEGLSAGTYEIREGRNYLRPAGRQRDPVPRTGWYIPREGKGGWLEADALRVEIPPGSEVRREIVIASTAAVVGKIVDAEGEPLRGVAVDTRFRSPGYSRDGFHHTRSREDGSFTVSEIEVPAGGDLTLRLRPPGFYGGVDVPGEKIVPLTLKPSEVTDLGTIQLEIVCGRVLGRLVDREGQPITGTIVDLESSDISGRGYSRNRSTGPDGEFEFFGLIPATYSLSSRDHDLLPHAVHGFRFPSGARELDLGEIVAVRDSWTFEGVLLLADGAPAAGARVRIDDKRELTADSDGRFSFEVAGRSGPSIEWTPAGEGPGAAMKEFDTETGTRREFVSRARGLLIELRDEESGDLVAPNLVIVQRKARDGTSSSSHSLFAPGPRIRIQNVHEHTEIKLRIDGYRTATVPEVHTVGIPQDEQRFIILQVQRRQ